MYELIYTSLPQGLITGRSGFSTAAVTEGFPGNLIAPIENLSGYKNLFPPGHPDSGKNPVNYSCQHYQFGSTLYIVLSRIAFAGLSYTGRSNILAHHLLFTEEELLQIPGGAVSILLAKENFPAWSGNARMLPQKSLRSLKVFPPSGKNPYWQKLAGNGQWAEYAAETFRSRPEKNMILSYDPLQITGEDVLNLIAESSVFLTKEEQLRFTFTTYCYSSSIGRPLFLRAYPQDSPYLGSIKRLNPSSVIYLGQENELPESGWKSQMKEVAANDGDREELPLPEYEGEEERKEEAELAPIALPEELYGEEKPETAEEKEEKEEKEERTFSPFRAIEEAAADESLKMELPVHKNKNINENGAEKKENHNGATSPNIKKYILFILIIFVVVLVGIVFRQICCVPDQEREPLPEKELNVEEGIDVLVTKVENLEKSRKKKEEKELDQGRISLKKTRKKIQEKGEKKGREKERFPGRKEIKKRNVQKNVQKNVQREKAYSLNKKTGARKKTALKNTDGDVMKEKALFELFRRFRKSESGFILLPEFLRKTERISVKLEKIGETEFSEPEKELPKYIKGNHTPQVTVFSVMRPEKGISIGYTQGTDEKSFLVLHVEQGKLNFKVPAQTARNPRLSNILEISFYTGTRGKYTMKIKDLVPLLPKYIKSPGRLRIKRVSNVYECMLDISEEFWDFRDFLNVKLNDEIPGGVWLENRCGIPVKKIDLSTCESEIESRNDVLLAKKNAEKKLEQFQADNKSILSFPSLKYRREIGKLVPGEYMAFMKAAGSAKADISAEYKKLTEKLNSYKFLSVIRNGKKEEIPVEEVENAISNFMEKREKYFTAKDEEQKLKETARKKERIFTEENDKLRDFLGKKSAALLKKCTKLLDEGKKIELGICASLTEKELSKDIKIEIITKEKQ